MTFDDDIDVIIPATILSIIKETKKKVRLRGRAYILKVKDEFFYATKIQGNEYEVFPLDFVGLQ